MVEKKKGRYRGREKAVIRLRVRQLCREAHDMGTHTQTISLITSDKAGAQGNGHNHGHFHCGALPAICPIYVFNSHTHRNIYKFTHSHPNIQLQTWKQKRTNTHGQTHTQRENDMTW